MLNDFDGIGLSNFELLVLDLASGKRKFCGLQSRICSNIYVRSAHADIRTARVTCTIFKRDLDGVWLNRLSSTASLALKRLPQECKLRAIWLTSGGKGRLFLNDQNTQKIPLQYSLPSSSFSCTDCEWEVTVMMVTMTITSHDTPGPILWHCTCTGNTRCHQHVFILGDKW